MARSERLPTQQPVAKDPAAAAHRFVTLFHHIAYPSEEQRALLAAAHYTLATQNTISPTRSKMHTNSAITVLKSIPQRKKEWDFQIAQAYCKRAELSEEEFSFLAATQDYQHAIDVFKHSFNLENLDNQQKLLMAQCAISIADILLHEQVNCEKTELRHPLFYINQGLEYLCRVDENNEATYMTLAYGHQIAGMALSSINFEAAIRAFRSALEITFKTKITMACPLLADIYSCLGSLYEQSFKQIPIQKAPFEFIDNASIYFGISLLFNPVNPKSPNNFSIETLFDMIHRVLDPYLTPLSPSVMRDFIDALIFAYYCLSEHKLPNQYINKQLSSPSSLNTFAQHVFWLISEAYQRDHFHANLLEIANPDNVDLSLDTRDAIRAILNPLPNNVYYLEIESSE